MSLSKKELETPLVEALKPIYLEIQDQADQHIGHAAAKNGHFRVTIVANCFIGKSRIERHRMVYNPLSSLFGFGVHALAIYAASPEEYALIE